MIVEEDRSGNKHGVEVGPLGVLVDLRVGEPDVDCLERLREHGLTVEKVVGNKVIGTVEGERLEELRAVPEVAEVELPSKLRPHADEPPFC